MVEKTKERPAQPDPDAQGNSQPQPPVPTLNIEVTIPVKYLSNFGGSLDSPLINCEIELDLSWTKDCVLMLHHDNITGINFMITSTKLCVPFCNFVY